MTRRMKTNIYLTASRKAICIAFTMHTANHEHGTLADLKTLDTRLRGYDRNNML